MDDLNTTGIETTVAETVTPEPAAPAESRRDSIARQLDEVGTEPPKNDATAAERARDDAGRFAAGKTKPAARPVLTAKGPVATAVVAPVTEHPWAKPPKSWAKKEHQDAWVKGDVEVLRQAVHTREEQMRAGIEQIIPKAKFADQVDQALAPFAATIQTFAGGDKLKAIASLAKADHNLRTMRGPEQAQFISGLLQSYGVDMKALFGIAQANPGVDTGALQSQLAAVTAERDSLKKAGQDAEDTKLFGEIEKLAKDKPNFEQARPYMAKYLRGGLADSYEEAYDLALRLNPSLAPKAAPATDPGNRQQLHQAAQRARSAAVSVKSATPATQTHPKAQDRRSVIAELVNNTDGRL